MPQQPEPRVQGSHQEASAADDWLLVADSLGGPAPQGNARHALEVDTSDMAGLLAGMKLQCTELTEAQRASERALQAQTDQARSQKLQLFKVTDDLTMSLDEHTLDMERRLMDRNLADCEALGKELRQELADDIARLQDEMEVVAEKLDEETRQRNLELQALERNMQQFKNLQKADLETVNERARRLQESIEALEKRSEESCSTQ